jgi:hypothetical protein
MSASSPVWHHEFRLGPFGKLKASPGHSKPRPPAGASRLPGATRDLASRFALRQGAQVA